MSTWLEEAYNTAVKWNPFDDRQNEEGVARPGAIDPRDGAREHAEMYGKQKDAEQMAERARQDAAYQRQHATVEASIAADSQRQSNAAWDKAHPTDPVVARQRDQDANVARQQRDWKAQNPGQAVPSPSAFAHYAD